MALGMEVGLSPGDFMLDAGPSPLPKRVEPHNFRLMSTAAKRVCMDQDATWYGDRPWLRRH